MCLCWGSVCLWLYMHPIMYENQLCAWLHLCTCPVLLECVSMPVCAHVSLCGSCFCVSVLDCSQETFMSVYTHMCASFAFSCSHMCPREPSCPLSFPGPISPPCLSLIFEGPAPCSHQRSGGLFCTPPPSMLCPRPRLPQPHPPWPPSCLTTHSISVWAPLSADQISLALLSVPL